MINALKLLLATISSAILVAAASDQVTEGRKGRAMTLEGAKVLCKLSRALKAGSAKARKMRPNVTRVVDAMREWRHRHGVKGRSWKAIVQALGKINIVNETEEKSIKDVYGNMETIMNNTNNALKVMDKKFLSMVKALYPFVNASESIGQVLKDLVVMFEKTTTGGCCLVESEGNCKSGTDGKCAEDNCKGAAMPSECNDTNIENVSDKDILGTLEEFKESKDIEFTSNESPCCWIMDTEEKANGAVGSFIVGTTGGFVKYSKELQKATIEPGDLISTLIKNYTTIKDGCEKAVSEYEKLNTSFPEFLKYEKQLKDLLSQNPTIRNHFREKRKRIKVIEDMDDGLLDEEGSIVKEQRTLLWLVSLVAVLFM